MTLSPSLEKSFSAQVTAEIEASLIYQQLAIELDVLGFTGMRTWMEAQVAEENTHAQRFINHILDREGHPQIGTVSVPELRIASPMDAFEAALKHERHVSELIRGLARQADEEGDIDSRPLLLEFIAEQVEEEATVNDIIDRLKIAGSDGGALLRLDLELGQRSE